MPFKKKILLSFLLGSCLVLLLAQRLFYAPVGSTDSTDEMSFQVRPGMYLSLIADSLHRSGLVNSPQRLRLVARLSGLDRGIQAGTFDLHSSMGPLELLRCFQSYQVPEWEVCLKEGLRLEDSVAELSRVTGLSSDRFMALCKDSSFARKVGLPFPSLEGCLFPETYRFSSAENEEGVLGILAQAFLDTWATVQANGEVGSKKAPNANGEFEKGTATPYDELILASIIQGEMQLAVEADTIAAVFHNRLRDGSKLQSCATVQYLLDSPRRLLLRDLEIKSPYNTYREPGLPPGPICSPGRVALKAAVTPASCDYLFFVARGDGGHYFSRTYDEHQRKRQPLDDARRLMR